MRHIPALLMIVLGLNSAACHSSVAAPTPAPLDLTGTWSGELTLSDSTSQMTWTLTQTNNVVSGPARVVHPSGFVLMNGTVTGTLSGTVLPYTISVAAGGIPSEPTCTGELAGTVNAVVSTTSTLTGSFAVTSSTCTTPISSGNFTLTKR